MSPREIGVIRPDTLPAETRIRARCTECAWASLWFQTTTFAEGDGRDHVRATQHAVVIEEKDL